MKHFTRNEQTMLENILTAEDYFLRLCEMALSCFIWKGLPDTCESTMIERALLFYGKCIFFRDDTIGELCLPFAGMNKFDLYGNPTQRKAYSNYNNYQHICNAEDSVIIYNNKMRTPYTINLMDFARRLYECDRTMDVNLKAQKTPVLITGKDNQMLSLKNVYKQFNDNMPVIFADKDFDSSAIAVLRTEAPFLCDKIWNLKTNIWNEALTYLGISNVSIEKRERLVTDEVERNQGGTLLNCNIRLTERQIACEKINKMFGTNIEVKFNEDLLGEYSGTSGETLMESMVDINE